MTTNGRPGNDPLSLAQFAFQGEAQGQGEDQGQGQGQGQNNSQANLQGEAQGQLNAQGELQGQGQGEAQGQGQSQSAEQHSVNTSSNGNGNLDLNGNGNGNGNANGNLNGNGNLNIGENSNHADNGLQNSDANVNGNLSANGVFNTVNNDVTSKVAVSVDVDAKVDTHMPTDSPVLHMDDLGIGNLSGSMLVMPDFGSQSLTGDGNNFHLDQVNNLVNNGTVSDVSNGISIFGDGGGPGGGYYGLESVGAPHGPDAGSGSPFSFTQNATANGGTSSDAANLNGDHGSLSSSASSAPTLTQEAFTQHIVLGSNIQYNSMPISVVGGDSYADGAHDIGHH